MEILLMEDSESLRRTTTRVLEREGHTVMGVGNGADGIVCLREACFDVIVSDLDMPRIDGIGVLRYCREQEIDTPVIIYTGTPHRRKELMGLGATEVVSKGLDAGETLLATVTRIEALHRTPVAA